MHSKFSTRSLLAALAVLILTACVYFLFAALIGDNGSRGGMDGSASQLTVEEKAAVLRSLTQTSEQNMAVTPADASARQRILENVAQSSSDSTAAEQSDAEKAKVLESLRSQ